MIDKIILGFLLIFGINGFRKGAIRMAFDFFSLFLNVAISFLVFKITRNPLKAWVVFVLIGIILPLAFKFIYKKIAQRPDYRLSILNRSFGLLLGFFWFIIILGVIFFSIILLPDKIPFVSIIKERVLSSNSYTLFVKFIPINNMGLVKRIDTAYKIISDKNSQEKLRDNPKLKELSQNDKIKAITEDEDLVFALQEKNYLKVLSHPKILAILQDGELIENILKIDLENTEKKEQDVKTKEIESKSQESLQN